MVQIAKWGVITPDSMNAELERKINAYMAQGYKRDIARKYAMNDMQKGW